MPGFQLTKLLKDAQNAQRLRSDAYCKYAEGGSICVMCHSEIAISTEPPMFCFAVVTAFSHAISKHQEQPV